MAQSQSQSCHLGADDAFGPAVGQGCRDNFDFTLLFEQSFFQIAPAALLLLIVPIRASQLRKQNVKVLRNGTPVVKQAAIAVLGITQLVLLILWSVTPLYRTRASIPAAALSFLASLSLLYLSSIEHSKSVRPSSIINFWVLVSLLLDIPQARTLWLRPGSRALPAIFTSGIAAKVAVLYLEARSKRRSLFPTYRVFAPEALANLYDRTTLWWLNPLFWSGYKDFLTIDTLYAVDHDLGSEQVEAAFRAQWDRQLASSRWAILYAISASVKWTFVAMVVPRFCLSALKLSQPLLIARVTSLLREGLSDRNANEARGLIGGAALIYIGIAITTALFQRELQRMLTMIRGMIISAVYSKALRLDSSNLADNAALTLITADVTRVCFSLQQFDQLFATPIETGVAIFILERRIGVSCVAPVAFAMLITAISFWNSNTAVPMQKAWLQAVSDRVAYTSAVLQAPKGFKMLGLTNYFLYSIQRLRVFELDKYAKYRKYVTWRNVFGLVPQAFAPPLTMMMFALVRGRSALDPTTVFTSLALVTLLTAPIQEMIHAVPQFQTALASLQRVQNFLRLEEGSVNRRKVTSTTDTPEAGHDIELSALSPSTALGEVPQAGVRLHAACVRLEDGTYLLRDADFAPLTGKLNMIVGPVGCGKSTLLKVIIGDTETTSGRRTVDKSTTFAFCAQDPWLPNATVRSLILGQSTYDDGWYTAVIDACGLFPDLRSLPDGDATSVGTKGVSLSGGQRHRVALARAVYARRKVLVADDVFSGLDANTARHIFTRVFGPHGLCKAQGMTVVLATHARQYLSKADHIIALGMDGIIVEQGQFVELLPRQGYVYELANASKGSDSNDKVEHVDETNALNKISAAAPDKVDMAQQDLARKTGDMAVYKYYAKAIGVRYCLSFVLATITFAFGERFPDLWFRFWSEDEASGSPKRPLGLWVGISFLLAVIACVACFAQIWIMLIHVVPKSSAQLHRQLLGAVMHATYKFFVTVDSGVTLNRFSNDMSIIEGELVGSVMQFAAGAAIMLAALILIVAGADYAAAALPFVFAVLYMIQKYYLRTSRQLRFLELESQAPLLQHCTETLVGVTTIRAFGWQHHSRQRFIDLLDRSQRAYYLMQCIQRWLGLVLGLLTAGIAIIVLSMALTIRNASSAGAVGVSLLGILSFSISLTYVVNAWTALETSLGAVARCKNFEASTPAEDQPGENHLPPNDWPSQGQVAFRDVTAAYNEGEDVLRSITMSIASGEKVGICGRTGSGKSSLLLTLFRLLEMSSGTIEVDGINISALPRQLVRERLTALPQEIITFPGSVHGNLDPLRKSTVEQAEQALDKVGLLELIRERGGLDMDMAALALSHGQLQLFAVARALLRKSKLLVLDEMSSSLDFATEAMIINLIKAEFCDSTVLAVAHRLKTIVDLDRVVVMDQGRIFETGTPQELLQRPDGAFRIMWERGGQH